MEEENLFVSLCIYKFSKRIIIIKRAPIGAHLKKKKKKDYIHFFIQSALRYISLRGSMQPTLQLSTKKQSNLGWLGLGLRIGMR